MAKMGFIQDFEAEKRAADLNLLTAVEKQVQGVLAELQYIAEILAINKNVAPVEDLRGKIKAAYEKIKAYLSADNANEQDNTLENKQSSGGLKVEQNPLIKEMGGMPLDVISPEWREKIEGAVLDKTELENLVNNKLKNRVELANKLKLQNKLKADPKLRIAQQMTPNFKKLQETLKYIIKEMPPPPKPAPTITVPPPRPY